MVQKIFYFYIKFSLKLKYKIRKKKLFRIRKRSDHGTLPYLTDDTNKIKSVEHHFKHQKLFHSI